MNTVVNAERRFATAGKLMYIDRSAPPKLTTPDNVLRPAWTAPVQETQKFLDFNPVQHPVDYAVELYQRRKCVDPLTSVDEINTMVRYFLDRDQVQNALIFMIGCNLGTRIGDTLVLRWKDVLTDVNRMTTQKTDTIIEFYPNEAIKEATRLYRTIASTQRSCEDDDFMFVSEGHRKGHIVMPDRRLQTPLQRQTKMVQPLRVETVSRAMTKAGKETGLATADRRISTHTCRKTHAEAIFGNCAGFTVSDDILERAQKVWMVQMALGHAKPETTYKHYLVADREVHQACCASMNFGLDEIRAYKRRKGVE